MLTFKDRITMKDLREIAKFDVNVKAGIESDADYDKMVENWKKFCAVAVVGDAPDIETMTIAEVEEVFRDFFARATAKETKN